MRKPIIAIVFILAALFSANIAHAGFASVEAGGSVRTDSDDVVIGYFTVVTAQCHADLDANASVTDLWYFEDIVSCGGYPASSHVYNDYGTSLPTNEIWLWAYSPLHYRDASASASW